MNTRGCDAYLLGGNFSSEESDQGSFGGGGATDSFGEDDPIVVSANRNKPHSGIIYSFFQAPTPQVYFGWPSSEKKNRHVDRHLDPYLSKKDKQKLLMKIRFALQNQWKSGSFKDGKHAIQFKGIEYYYGAHFRQNDWIINVGTIYSPSHRNR